MKLIQLIAHCFMFEIPDKDDDDGLLSECVAAQMTYPVRADVFIESLWYPLSWLSTFVTHGNADRSHPIFMAVAVQTITVWHPTLQTLRQLSRQPGNQERHHILKCYLSAWTRLGQTFELSELNPNVPHVEKPPHPSAIWWKARGCNWKHCLCAVDPCHTLKMCKGCWRVLYCSARCQML